MRIIVTGATGFVGQALLPRLLEDGHDVAAAVRTAGALPVESSAVGKIDSHTEWRRTLTGADCVAHLAARVHQLNDGASEPMAAYRETNTRGTVRLAEAAVAAGVKRFVFLSTAKVLGEASPPGGFSDESRPAPQDPYAISKWEAEQGLRTLSHASGLEVVILRPPLVYGPGVRANFLRLMNWVDRGYPLPFGAVHNQRSLVALSNLVDAIAACVTHPSAAGETFLVGDDQSLSTPELIRQLAAAIGRPAQLMNVPPSLLRVAGRLSGRSAEIDRLLGDFLIDSSRIRQVLGWDAPESAHEALTRTIGWYRSLRAAE